MYYKSLTPWRPVRVLSALALLLLAARSLLAGDDPKSPLDTASVERLTGLKGTWNAAERVFKVTAPRTDVPVEVDGWTMPPFVGLTSWAAFKASVDGKVMVMGDLVLFEDEVSPAMSAALESGLEVTALHNHFLHEKPRVFFMHLAGDGAVEMLAGGVGKTLAAVKAVRAAAPRPAAGFGGPPVPARSAITAPPLDALFGLKGTTKDGMYKAVVGRSVTMACGCEAGAEMGVNTWAAFAGTDENAIVDGDFAVHEDELQPVLKALRKAGIHVVAIHHHMTGESPRTLFLHYWGRGPAAGLARGLKSALAAASGASASSRSSPNRSERRDDSPEPSRARRSQGAACGAPGTSPDDPATTARNRESSRST